MPNAQSLLTPELKSFFGKTKAQVKTWHPRYTKLTVFTACETYIDLNHYDLEALEINAIAEFAVLLKDYCQTENPDDKLAALLLEKCVTILKPAGRWN